MCTWFHSCLKFTFSDTLLQIGNTAHVSNVAHRQYGFCLWNCVILCGFLGGLTWVGFFAVFLYLVLHATFSYMYVFPFKFKCNSSCHEILNIIYFLSLSFYMYLWRPVIFWVDIYRNMGFSWTGLSCCLIYTVKYIFEYRPESCWYVCKYAKVSFC